MHNHSGLVPDRSSMNVPKARTVRSLSTIFIGVVTGVAGTVAAYSVWSTRAAPIESPPSFAPTESASEYRSASQDAVAEDSAAQLAAALARIDQLYAERERDWQQTAAWVETLLDNRKPESSARTVALERVRRKLEIRKKAEEGQMLAGLDDGLMLIFATLLAGDEAIADLCAVVEDSTLNLEMRTEAFQTLGYLPSDQALEITLHPPDDLAAMEEFALEQQMEKLALLADFLPPESIAPHADTLYGVAVRRLDIDSGDGDAWKLIAALAWEHQHAGAMKTLNDPRNTRFLGEELLRVAWWSATDGGREYIERMSRTHPTPEIRQQAANILAGWPES